MAEDLLTRRRSRNVKWRLLRPLVVERAVFLVGIQALCERRVFASLTVSTAMAKVFAPPEGRKSLSSVYSMRSTTYKSLAERDACLHSSTPAAPEEMDAFPEASFVVRSHDQFISYSWNGSRRGKWWSLLYLHNFPRAIVAMILALATCLAVLFVLMELWLYAYNTKIF